MEDAAVLFALLAVGLTLAIPVSIVILFRRQRNLRIGFDEALDNQSRQNDALHRELLDLKRQVANLRQTSTLPSPSVPEVKKEVPVAHSAIVEVTRESSQSAGIHQSRTADVSVPIARSAAEKPPTVEQPPTPERHVNIEPVTPAARETAIPVTISRQT